MKNQIRKTGKNEYAGIFTTKQMLTVIAGAIGILILAQNAALLLGAAAVSCGVPSAAGIY